MARHRPCARHRQAAPQAAQPLLVPCQQKAARSWGKRHKHDHPYSHQAGRKDPYKTTRSHHKKGSVRAHHGTGGAARSPLGTLHPLKVNSGPPAVQNTPPITGFSGGLSVVHQQSVGVSRTNRPLSARAHGRRLLPCLRQVGRRVCNPSCWQWPRWSFDPANRDWDGAAFLRPVPRAVRHGFVPTVASSASLQRFSPRRGSCGLSRRRCRSSAGTRTAADSTAEDRCGWCRA